MKRKISLRRPVESFRVKFKKNYGLALCFALGLAYIPTTGNAEEKYPEQTVIRQSVQQNRKITGIVQDENGEGLAGASVVVKGTTIGISTDVNGNFSLEVPNEAILQISHVGYRNLEVPVGNQEHLTISLTPDESMLDELVVVGYGTVRKRDLTGSVQSLKSKDLTAIPTNNVLEALQGKVAGVDLTKTSGQAGSGVSFTIRGNRSLKASNEPLVIVDGFPNGNTIDINPSDIESIEILKDAASTAIYGTRGANGVILITTKKGKDEKARVNFSSYYTINQVTDYIPSFSAEEYIAHLLEGVRTNKGNEMATGSFVANPTQTIESLWGVSNPKALQYIQDREFVDWLDKIFQTGHTQNYELSVTGGSASTQYSTSLGFMDEGGVIPNNEAKRFNVRANISQKLFKNLTLGVNLMYSYKNTDGGFSAFNQAGKMIPIAKPWNDDGTLNLWPSPSYSTKLNPLAYVEIPHSYVDNTLAKRTLVNVDLNWEIIPGLSAKTLFSADVRDSRRGRYNQNFEAASSTIVNDYLYTGWQTQNLVNYNKTFGLHGFQFMAGQEFQTWFEENASAEGASQTTPLTSFHYLASTTTGQRISSDLKEASLMSFFGRVNYKFTEKYLLNLSLRADRSSVLAADHQWGYFPAAAVAWRVSEESFLKDVSAIDNLKLRLSWGLSGNSAIDPYQTLGGLSIAYMTSGNAAAMGYYPSAFANPDLTWETTSSYNVGLDFGIIKNRISGSADFFVANTSNLLLPSKLPSTSGYADKMENVGSTGNVGIEGTVSAVIFQHNKGFNWSIDLNASHVTEEIISLTGGQIRDEANLWFVGKPLRVFYDYKKEGIWQIDEYAQAQALGQTYGQIKVSDLDGDNQITPEDRWVYNRSPKFVFGINNTFRYQGFDLTAFVYGRLGQWINVTDYTQIFYNGLENSPKHDYWTPENPTNAYPRPNDKISTGQYLYGTTLGYTDGSYVKLRDVTLGYTLPQSLLQKLSLSQLRVYVSGKNFATWSKIKHYDPERDGAETWPMYKQVIFGLNINF